MCVCGCVHVFATLNMMGQGRLMQKVSPEQRLERDEILSHFQECPRGQEHSRGHWKQLGAYSLRLAGGLRTEKGNRA